MKKNTKFCLAGVFSIIFILFIVLIKTVDVADIGPMETSVGLSHINGVVHSLFGENLFWYDLTVLFGGVAIAVCGAFGLVGVSQLIKRKSLTKVDKELYALLGLYVVMLTLYVLFEKIIINYRPIIMPGESEPEASFPSSHTMLICVVMISAAMVVCKYIKNDNIRRIIQVICVIITVITVIGRLICGVHWFTDILGGVIISAALLFAFSGVISDKT